MYDINLLSIYRKSFTTSCNVCYLIVADSIIKDYSGTISRLMYGHYYMYLTNIFKKQINLPLISVVLVINREHILTERRSGLPYTVVKLF